MGRILDYELDTVISRDNKVICTDIGDSNETKNITVGNIVDLAISEIETDVDVVFTAGGFVFTVVNGIITSAVPD